MRVRIIGSWDETRGVYHLYITNLPVDKIKAEEIGKLYAARWTVELLFRELKSCYQLESLPSRKSHVVQAFLYASLLTPLASRALLFAIRPWGALAERRTPIDATLELEKPRRPFSLKRQTVFLKRIGAVFTPKRDIGNRFALNGLAPVGFTEVLHHLRFDGRTIPIVGVRRQLVVHELREQSFPQGRLQRRDMEEGGVVEPDQLPRCRVPCDGGADRVRPQGGSLRPLELDSLLPAVMLDHLFVCRLEHRLPGESEPVTEVADVYPLPAREALLNLRRDTRQDQRLASSLPARLPAGRGKRSSAATPFDKEFSLWRKIYWLAG